MIGSGARRVAYRGTFDCLWCGAHHEVRASDDLEGWAHLCPDCIGRAGDNEFLRFRLRHGLQDRATAARPTTDHDLEPDAVVPRTPKPQGQGT